MSDMTWQEKWAALKDIAPDAQLTMRRPGDWYISNAPSVMVPGFEVGANLSAETPRGVVGAYWRVCVEADSYDGKPVLALRVWYGPDEGVKFWNWAGHRWKQVSDDELAARRGVWR